MRRHEGFTFQIFFGGVPTAYFLIFPDGYFSSRTKISLASKTPYNAFCGVYAYSAKIPQYAKQLRTMLTDLQDTYGYSEQDAMLVLKDILAHEYMDNRKK